MSYAERRFRLAAASSLLAVSATCGGAVVSAQHSGADASAQDATPSTGDAWQVDVGSAFDSPPVQDGTAGTDGLADSSAGDGDGGIDAESLDSAAVDSCSGYGWPDAANTYTVGGTVTGLEPGFGLDLIANGCDVLFVGGVNGPFTFPTRLPPGHAYSVTILSSGENCTVINGSGTIGDADVTNVVVPCTVKDQ
jgi:hypothetical protein